MALGKKYRNEGVFQVDQYEHRLALLLPNCGGRTIKGYANLMWFSEEVRSDTMLKVALELQVAMLVGESKEHVWEVMAKFTPQLNQLQQKDETITSATPLDPDAVCELYWRIVGSNLIDLATKFSSRQQVRHLAVS